MIGVKPLDRPSNGGDVLRRMSLDPPPWFALEGFNEAPATEVAPFGMEVMIVEPGAFRTSFSSGADAVRDELRRREDLSVSTAFGDV